MKIQKFKKKIGGGPEQRIEVFVKIQKKKRGWGSGGVRVVVNEEVKLL